MASQITTFTIVYSTVIQAQIKENIKAPRHWPLCGEFTGEFPAQMASNAEKVSIWWRHHVKPLCLLIATATRQAATQQLKLQVTRALSFYGDLLLSQEC